MDYQKRIVCYFDILGFSRVVCDRRLSVEEIGNLFSEIDCVIKEEDGDAIDSIYFSDSFVVSIKRLTLSARQLRLIISILHKLIEYRLLARGGVAYGDLVHEGSKLYGPALVKAVELEHTAEYPRILLDESLADATIPTIGQGKIDYHRFFTDFVYVKTDSMDGKAYIDYISPIIGVDTDDHKRYISILSGMLEEGLSSGNARLIKKYEWLKGKMSIGG
jgi:hypothetical protein